MTAWNRPTVPKWDAKKPVAPFGPAGDLQHYPESTGYGDNRRGPEWRDVRPWSTTLTLVGYARGRSAAYFLLKDKQGHTYPMMLSDFTDLVMTRTSAAGVFSGWWAVKKRGQNYGIQAIERPSL